MAHISKILQRCASSSRSLNCTGDAGETGTLKTSGTPTIIAPLRGKSSQRVEKSRLPLARLLQITTKRYTQLVPIKASVKKIGLLTIPL
jgi:hypothetical protein